MKLLHTMVRILDADKSLKFYQDILGLKLNRTMDLPDCTLYFLRDGVSDVELELTHNHTAPEGGYELGKTFGHFAFEIESMDDFTKILESNGIKYTRAPFEIKPGLKIAFINDPDGMAIELIEKTNTN